MDFEEYLKSSIPKIDKQIELSLKEWKTEGKNISPKLVPLVNYFVNACSGGKRLRGVLVKMGFALTNTRYTDEIVKCSAAVEIFQTAILAHDDIIDQSSTRRGKQTIYKALGEDHYAISQTICLGDLGLFLAAKLVSDTDFPEPFKNKVFSLFSKLIIDTALGQMLDVELPHLKEDRKESDVIAIHRLKTAYYTIVYPLSLGVILGGGGQSLLDKIMVFGENLGIAFQVQDDILGVFGDERTIGKSVISDIAEGKNTLLITFALEKADQNQRKILGHYYGKKDINMEEFNLVKKVFEDTGALDYSKRKAQEYVNIAKEVIPQITEDPKLQELLSGMADFLVNRDK